MDRATVDVYEQRAREWAAKRTARHAERAVLLAAEARSGLPVADLGCGPGHYVAHLGPVVVAVDAAAAMLALVPPAALRIQADLEALPLRDRSLGGAWASNSYLHVPRDRLPLALARLHWAMAVGAPLTLSTLLGEGDGPWPGDDFPGRAYAYWEPDELARIMIGAGFDVEHVSVEEERVWATARRARTLPDLVTPDLRVLVCGLNPSVYSADAGLAFARPGNRFWPAAMAAGLVTRARDPLWSVVHDRVGFTDLVKRATPAADVLTPDEYRAGVSRVRALVEWLQPGLVLFVGLAGWRAAVDRGAVAGLQPELFGGAPAYLMPSTSGLNASSKPADAVAHMAAALAARSP
ncbi:MAG TPA: uracil-DNA glycosylase family protein [Acidimicrobiales bacterium]|jgi:TDG/mug DNA glycosylase family protein|nr:uracil-DNA glycosylase family protein [Acidimicrobiales bacterium]